MGAPTTTTTNTAPPAEVLAQYGNLVNRATGVANTPYSPYTGSLVAPQNTYQQIAEQRTLGAPADAWPFLGTASSEADYGAGLLGVGANMAGNAPGYFNSAGSTIGGALPYISGGAGIIGGALPSYQTAANYAQQSAGAVNPMQFSGEAVQQYMSPYTQKVIDTTMANINRNNAIQQNQLRGSAILGGNAFGGDRAGVAAAELARNQDLASGQIMAGLENQGYSQALGEFNTQQGVDLQARQANMDRLARAAGLSLGVGQGQVQAGQAYAGLASPQIAAGQALGNVGSQYGNLAGLYGNLGLGAGSLANTTANLGFGATGTEIAAANALQQQGATAQQTQQNQLNAAYQQFLQQQGYPFQTTGWLGNLVLGLGNAAGGTSTTSQPSWLSSIFGGHRRGGPVHHFQGGGGIPYASQGGIGAYPYANVAGFVPNLDDQMRKYPSTMPKPPSTTQSDPLKTASNVVNMYKGASGLSKDVGSGYSWLKKSAPALFSSQMAAEGIPIAAASESAVSGGSIGLSGALPSWIPSALLPFLAQSGGLVPRIPSGAQFPKGYHDAIPVERRIVRTGISHPGYRWQVYDKQTGSPIGQEYMNAPRARSQMDKLDNQYGGYKHGVKPVEAQTATQEEIDFLNKAGITLGGAGRLGDLAPALSVGGLVPSYYQEGGDVFDDEKDEFDENDENDDQRSAMAFAPGASSLPYGGGAPSSPSGGGTLPPGYSSYRIRPEPSGFDQFINSPWAALAGGVLGMLGSRSPDIGGAIAAGGLSGLGILRKQAESREKIDANPKFDHSGGRSKVIFGDGWVADLGPTPLSEKEKETKSYHEQLIALRKEAQADTKRQRELQANRPMRMGPDASGREQVWDSKQNRIVPADEYGREIAPSATTVQPLINATDESALPSTSKPTAGSERDDEYLKAVAAKDKEAASTIKGLADYEINPTTIQARRRAFVLGQVKTYDPSYDQALYPARAAAIKEFLSGGQTSPSANIVAGNTSIKHLGELADASEKIGGTNNAWILTKPINWIRSHTQELKNDPDLKEYVTTLDRFAEEATKFYRGTGGSLTDVERTIHNLTSAQSPAARAAGISKETDLFADKVNALQEKWKNALGGVNGWRGALKRAGVEDFPIIQKTTAEAMEHIHKLHERHGLPEKKGTASTESGPVRVRSPEEARKLPKGTSIILPDGRHGTVP